jgi:hypothetical protein
MWSEDGDMEIGYDIEGGNTYSPKRQKKIAHGEAGGETPGTEEEQDKNATVQDGIRDKNQRSYMRGGEGWCSRVNQERRSKQGRYWMHTYKNLLVNDIYIYIYKVATININGVRSEPRHDMLAGFFLHKQDIDVALLQEVRQPGITVIQRYIAWINLGNERRGTAILTRD